MFENLMQILSYSAVAGVAFIVLYLIFKSRYKIAGPNELLVVYGRRSSRKGPVSGDAGVITSGARIITGGGTFIWPGWEQYRRMSLELMTLSIEPGEINSRQGIPVRVRAVAQVKVGGSDEAMHQAVQGFLSYKHEQMEDSLRETLSGHLRGIVGTQTIEELNFKRSTFQQSVRDQADKDLEAMGFEIKSIVIQEIVDSRGYMEAIATPEVSRAEKGARIARAESSQDSLVAEEESRYISSKRKIQVDTDLLEETKKLHLREAVIRKEVSVAQAEAEKAGELTETKENIKIATQAVTHQRQILDASVREKADADLYATEQKANADAVARERAASAAATALTLAADAAAHEKRVTAGAYAEATKVQGTADAVALEAVGVAEGAKIAAVGVAEGAKIAAIGNAQAEAVRLLGLAEAEGLLSRAKSLAFYDDDAIRLELIETLPEVIAAAAAPLARAGETTIISSGGTDGNGTGVVKMSEDVWAAVTLVEQKTGISLRDILAKDSTSSPNNPTLDVPANRE